MMQANRFTVTDTYELIENEDDARASFDYPDAIYVMTAQGVRRARLVKRVVDMTPVKTNAPA